jgi:hypothetical protein
LGACSNLSAVTETSAAVSGSFSSTGGEKRPPLRLAWALEIVVEEELHDEVLELGWPQAEAVIRAVPEVPAHAYDGLDVLLQAARRLADDPQPSE